MLQPLLRLDPLHPLVVHSPAFQPETPVDKPAPPTHVAPGQLADAPAQLMLLNRPLPEQVGAECCGSDRADCRHGAEKPGIDPAEHTRLCVVVPDSEVSLG